MHSVQLLCLVISFSVQLFSHVWPFVTSWTVALQASLSINNSWSLLKLMSTELLMPSNHFILCCLLLLLPSIFPPSGSFPMNQFFTSGRQSIGASASASVLPMNIQGWFSFWMDWLYLLAVQGTLKNLLQHHSSKASILHCSAFLIVQRSHSYKTTRKAIALTRWTFVGKVMSLLYNMLSRLVITFLP